MLVGEAMFFAYLAIHSVTILELLLDLATARQTQPEKRRDYAQLAQSAIAVGVGLALLLLAWLAGMVSRAVAGLLESLGIKPRISLPPAASRFLRGAGSVRKPRSGSRSADDVAARLAAEQRLAPQVGGPLARQLVEDLGAEAAEQLVARLGASNVRRLGAELASQAIAVIADRLAPNVVERLLDGGLGPRRIDAAVAAGQAQRLTALSTAQIGKLAALSEAGFTRIIQLPQATFPRFINLADAQLRAFAQMEEAAFNRFAALDEAVFGRFGNLTPQQLQTFAAMSDHAFSRFAALDAASFGKFERFGPDMLARFASVNDPAFARFAALPADEMAKFEGMTVASMERLSRLRAGELENMARDMTSTELHRQVLGRDPATGGAFRANEAETALRVERRRGIVLDRYEPRAPGQKGDWIDGASNKVYDGCSPAPSQHFDQQITNGRYEASLRDHLNHPTVDFVVVDITGLNLTPAQEATLDALIIRVGGAGNPKIVRIP
jgi:hypothetical protein